MTMALGLGLGLPFAGAAASAVGIVTAAAVLGDIDIAITNPSTMTVSMQTNGSAIRLTTAGVVNISAIDATKITMTVTDRGWNTDGSVNTARSRTIGCRGAIFGPYNETGKYQPNLGEFYLKMDDFIFNQDATWKTTVVSINLAAGWIPGALAETVTSVTRLDSLAYFIFPFKSPTSPWQNVVSGGTLTVQYSVAHAYPFNMSPIACVEAWAVDASANVGPVARSSTFARSASTPNDATLKGFPVPTYSVDVPITGLVDGRGGVRATFKPWIGPSVDTWGNTYCEAYPTYNTATELPFSIDAASNHAPMYGMVLCIAGDTPAALTRRITNNTNVATVDDSGICPTRAGAIASGVFYDNLQTFLTAVQRFNNSGSNRTILSNDGLSTQSTKRATAHNDISGATAVCAAVSGSVKGADAGAYSLFADCSGFASGLTGCEITSYDGLPHDNVRWRGVHSDGTALAFTARLLPKRVRLRGITSDSTGVASAANNVVFNQGGSAGAPTTLLAEANAAYVCRHDCVIYNVDPGSVSAGTSISHFQSGYTWDFRVEETDIPSGTAFMSSSAAYSGKASAIGCSFGTSAAVNLSSGIAPCTLGNKFKNFSFAGSGPSTAKPAPYGQMFSHNKVEHSLTTLNVQLLSLGSGIYNSTFPMRGGMGIIKSLFYASGTTFGTSGLAIHGDGSRHEIDGLIVDGITVAFPNAAASAGGRANIGYQEAGFIRINKRILWRASVVRNYNVKGDVMVAPETVATSNFGDGAFGSTSAYFKGDVVTSGGNDYQALQDIPANSGILITNTDYWFASGVTSATSYGARPLRQGNGDFRDHVGCFGNVAVETSSGTVPDVSSWYGHYWGADEAYAATWGTAGDNLFTSPSTGDFTAKAAGPLKSRVPTGKAQVPFDLAGTALVNDGTDSAGALQ